MTALGVRPLIVTLVVSGLVLSGAGVGVRPPQHGPTPARAAGVGSHVVSQTAAPARAAAVTSPARANARTLAHFLSAGDTDSTRLGGPTGGRGGILLRAVGVAPGAANATFLRRLGDATDVIALSTRPSTRLGPARQTVTGARLALLASVDRDRSTSIRPRWAPPPEDSRYIKDAVIAYIGATGATAWLNSTRLDGMLVLPPNGTVLEFVDYRVEPPEDTTNRSFDRESKTITVTADATGKNESVTETETVTFTTPDGETLSTTVSVTAPPNETDSETETITATVDGRRTRTTYRVKNRSVRRQLQLADRLWTKNTTPGMSSRGARQLAYTGAPATGGATTLRLQARITVWLRETTVKWDWHPTSLDDGHWDRANTTTRFLRDQETVSTQQSPVWVTPHTNRNLTVHQRVITGGGETVVVVRFDGPSSLTHRRLWSWARLTDQQLLVNGWGVYARQRQPGGALEYSTTDPNGQPVDFPPTLRLRLTAISPASTRAIIGSPGPRLARVTTVQTTDVGQGPARLPPRVNISAAQPHVTRAVVLRNAPGPVKALYDVHGDRIPITTERAVFHATGIETTRLNATTVKLRLIDIKTGSGIGGRTLRLDGARQTRVKTSNTGGNLGVAIVRVPPSTEVLSASFAGTPVTADRSIFLESSSTTLPMAGPYDMVGTFTALFTSGLPFFVLAALLSAVYLIVRARPDTG